MSLPKSKKPSGSRSKKPSSSSERSKTKYPQGTPRTGLYRVVTSMYLPIPPIANEYPLAGIIANSISPLLLTYYPPLKGIVIGFTNARFSTPPDVDGRGNFARIIDCYAQPYVWVTAEMLLFQPVRGAWMDGVVQFQTESHVGLVVWNVFHAVVERHRMPADWQWVPLEKSSVNGGDAAAAAASDIVPDQWVVATSGGKHGGKSKNKSAVGAYFDGNGSRVEGTLAFRARDFDFDFDRPGNLSLMTIEGSLLTEEKDREIDERLGKPAQSKEAVNGVVKLEE